jgi:hypothetical protein
MNNERNRPQQQSRQVIFIIQLLLLLINPPPPPPTFARLYPLSTYPPPLLRLSAIMRRQMPNYLTITCQSWPPCAMAIMRQSCHHVPRPSCANPNHHVSNFAIMCPSVLRSPHHTFPTTASSSSLHRKQRSPTPPPAASCNSTAGARDAAADAEAEALTPANRRCSQQLQEGAHSSCPSCINYPPLLCSLPRAPPAPHN